GACRLFGTQRSTRSIDRSANSASRSAATVSTPCSSAKRSARSRRAAQTDRNSTPVPGMRRYASAWILATKPAPTIPTLIALPVRERAVVAPERGPAPGRPGRRPERGRLVELDPEAGPVGRDQVAVLPVDLDREGVGQRRAGPAGLLGDALVRDRGAEVHA